MGGGRFDPEDWDKYARSKSYSTKSTQQIFTQSTMADNLNPRGVDRESRDSDDNPNSTPLIFAFDVTGSMGEIPGYFAKEGLVKLFTEIFNKDRRTVTDPHVMVAAIGDAAGDSAPLQVSQFEADMRIAEQLEKLYLERGGCGNGHESYALMWYFAARHTSIDSFEKRGKKGYLFTIGDEGPTPILYAKHLKHFIGDNVSENVSIEQILTEVSRTWEVFHIIIEQGDGINMYGEKHVVGGWQELLGERAIRLKDKTKLSEVVTSIIQVMEGEDHDKVVQSWNGDTSLVVSHAVKSLSKGTSKSQGVVTL